jgi:hypothetical protein
MKSIWLLIAATMSEMSANLRVSPALSQVYCE